MVTWKLFNDEGYRPLVVGMDDQDGEIFISDGNNQLSIDDLDSLVALRKELKLAIAIKKELRALRAG